MMKFRGILTILCLVVASLLPKYTYAQIDAAAFQRGNRSGQNMGMGNNNMSMNEGMDEGEGEQTDTTQTEEKRERKPLESYYFGDTVRALNNWQWTIDRDFDRVNIQPLDTTLQDWRIDYVLVSHHRR